MRNDRIAGHTEVARELLKDKRVDPSVLNNRPLELAKRGGHTEIVAMLLQDERCKALLSANGPEVS